MNKILDEIARERSRQNKKFGEQNLSPAEWMIILMEEVGEAAKDTVDHHFKLPVKNYEGDIFKPSIGDQAARLARYRKELVQIAAVAVHAIECLDKQGE